MWMSSQWACRDRQPHPGMEPQDPLLQGPGPGSTTNARHLRVRTTLRGLRGESFVRLGRVPHQVQDLAQRPGPLNRGHSIKGGTWSGAGGTTAVTREVMGPTGVQVYRVQQRAAEEESTNVVRGSELSTGLTKAPKHQISGRAPSSLQANANSQRPGAVPARPRFGCFLRGRSCNAGRWDSDVKPDPRPAVPRRCPVRAGRPQV